ncbi:MAG: hypothetical protein V1489_00335 [Candidatus Liptonbacteria bacterium]
MEALLNNLGIDWRLLLSQAVNFGLLLTVLRIFAYKPIVKLMKDRQARIEEGLVRADEADRRLLEANEGAKVKIKEAEAEGLAILRKTEADAKTLETRLTAEAHDKEAQLMKDAEAKAKEKEREANEAFRKEAAELVKAAIVKTVELSPDAVDRALVERAVKEIGDKTAAAK